MSKKDSNKITHPEYSTWWDRNQGKVILSLVGLFFLLLLIARLIMNVVYEYPSLALVWLIIFSIDLILLSLLVTRPPDHFE